MAVIKRVANTRSDPHYQPTRSFYLLIRVIVLSADLHDQIARDRFIALIRVD